MSSVLVELEGGIKCAFPIANDLRGRQFYQLVGASTSHRLSNKDLTDPSNNLGVQAATPFTVSADSRVRGRFQTIQAAIDAAAAVANITGRKLVVIAPGNYNENVTLAPYVDVVGSGANTIIYGVLSHTAGYATVSNLRVTSSGAAFIQTGGALAFNDCVLFSSISALVNGVGAVLEMNECTLDCATPDVLTIAAASGTTITRSTIGSNAVGQKIQANSGVTVVMYSTLKCQLYTSGGTCYASHTRFGGDNNARVQLVSGALEAYHCNFESPVSASPAVTGTGTFTSDYNVFKGRTTIDSTVEVRHNEEQSTSGTYAPAVTGSHVASVASATGMYTRAGNIVTVTFAAVFTPTVGGIFSFDISVPLTGANFAATSDAAGAISWDNGSIIAFSHVRAKVGTALLTATSIGTPTGAATTFSGTFSYILR